MKKTIFAACALAAFALSADAINTVTFEITDGLSDPSLKSAIETNTKTLLERINEAQEQGKKSINFKGINISESARDGLLSLWENMHLRVWEDVEGEEPYIGETALQFNRAGEYQVRNIPMRKIPVTDAAGDGRDYVEVVLNYNGTGKIVDFNLAIDRNVYSDMIKEARDVEDQYNRRMVAYWMERLQTAYNQRDLQFFDDIFSEDALIITGSRNVTRQKADVEGMFKAPKGSSYTYVVQTKQEYLDKLKNRIFPKKRNPYINISFQDQSYRMHSGNPRYFFVDCTQIWQTTTYSDEGHLFLVWDFKNPEEPMILVRTWQALDDPNRIDETNLPGLPL